MGCNISGILAILFMDRLETIALSSHLSISPHRRCVHDLYLQTTGEEMADQFHHAGIEIKTTALENDPANLPLFEAFYKRKYKPALNSQEECSKFADLLFKHTYRDSLFFDTRPLHHIIRFYPTLYLIICLVHFTPPHSFTFHTFLLHICI